MKSTCGLSVYDGLRVVHSVTKFIVSCTFRGLRAQETAKGCIAAVIMATISTHDYRYSYYTRVHIMAFCFVRALTTGSYADF